VAQVSESQKDTSVSFAVRFRPAYEVDSVIFFSGRHQTPYKIHSDRRQQYFPISAKEDNYLVKAQSSDGECVNHHVEGFGTKAIVFRAAEHEAVRIPNHRVLRPGTYLAVSARSILSRFHDLLGARPLKTIAGLHAALIDIPEDPSLEVRNNVSSVLGFETASAISRYAFISPLSVNELAPDCWEVGEDNEVAVLLSLSKHLVPRPTRLLVQERRSGRVFTEYLSLKEYRDHIVLRIECTPETATLRRIGLADPPRFILEIRAANQIVEPRCARFSFSFSSKSKPPYSLAWSSHDLPQELAAASRDEVKLVSVSKPKLMEMIVSDRSGHRAIIAEDSPHQQLMDFLKRAKFPAILSVQGYPNITIRRPRTGSTCPTEFAYTLNLRPCSRRTTRLFDAFRRGYASPYSIQSVRS
jgi:hypothetical protein